MTLSINEKSAAYFTFTFTDEDERSMVPVSLDWELHDKDTDTELQAWASLTPAAKVDLTIPAALNAIVTPASATETRVLTVRVDSGLGSEAYEQQEYTVTNLEYVP